VTRAPAGRFTSMDPVYITTPIYYVNAEPHLGHTYTTVVADTLARYFRQRGRRTFLVTGTDEHGDKVALAAAAAGVTPQEHADRTSRLFRDTWDQCGIQYDHFIRTTDPYHIEVVREILQRVHDAGDIYFSSYGGLYCTGCERFYTEKELVDGKCPDHLTVPAFVDEQNYFFRMSKYQGRLVDELTARPDLILPERYRNEVLAMLRDEALGDLCISRPKSRLTWGIELPFDDNYVTYVWFDALINYLSALRVQGEGVLDELWPYAQHLIGKDILKPHGIFWPTMLMAAGLPLFKGLRVHGFWTHGESKMSKSLGNVIRPLDMKSRFGMDSFRYFLLREMAFGQDATFSADAFITRVNADLANNLGNLISRTLAMQTRYFAGEVQELTTPWTKEDEGLAAAHKAALDEVPSHVEQFNFHRALESAWRAIDRANKYIVETAPFKLAKDDATKPRTGAILHHLLEGLYVTAFLVEPFLPETAASILALLGLPAANVDESWEWGKAIPAGHRVGAPEVLFPRIEPEEPT
jgi:methionyl-tRNA synthetase